MKRNGISHQFSCPRTPEQNGVSERLNQTLNNSARMMLSYANLGNEFWEEAVRYANFIKNRVSSTAVEKTPYELFTGWKATLGFAKIFGCDAFAHIAKEQRKKWDKRSKKMIHLGCDIHSKGYRLWDPNRRRLVI
ncbi:MAG: transposase family protein, partial [Mycoplasma sp.]|nr:transposase family protein [Mycoplasma sp.]